MLLSIGANINKTDKKKNTSLHYACLNKDYEILTLLLADPNLNY